MTNTLIGCDPKEVSPARAGAAFSEFAKKLATEQGMDFTAAWNRAKLIHPDLHARMCEGANPDSSAAPKAALTNAAGTPQPPIKTVLAAAKPLVAGAFHLPPNVDEELLNMAYTANGGQWLRVDASKVFMGVQMFMMKSKGLKPTDARLQVIQDFPELALFAKQTPQPTPTNTGGVVRQS